MRKYFIALLFVSFIHDSKGQGCSDAGICTIGDFYKQSGAIAIPSMKKARHELDLSFTYGTHGVNERFFQPQFNYRYNWKRKMFFEFKVPLSIAKDKSSQISNAGIGDVIATFNNVVKLHGLKSLQYSAGFRISLTNADESEKDSVYSYPMFLQPGLGSTDFLLAGNLTLANYLSVGAGLQIPFFNYNSNLIRIPVQFGQTITAEQFYRRPDAILKVTGHHQFKDVKINAGLLGIFHLEEDYYRKSSIGRYTLNGSKGTTINWNMELMYKASEKWMVSLLYAEPLKTRAVIPDGLARSRIATVKLGHSF